MRRGGGQGGGGGAGRPLQDSAEAGPRKPPRCPACGAFPDRYEEVWSRHGIQFPADERGRPAKEGLLYEGDPVKVVAVCRCGKEWTVRGVRQIDGLERQP